MAETAKDNYKRVELHDNLEAGLLHLEGIKEVVELQKKLGQGAFGSVFRGQLKIPIIAPDGTLIDVGTMVAVKEQNLSAATDFDLLATEIEALKKAMQGHCSAYVNQIYDVLYDQNKGKLYLIMEFIRGIEMFKWITREGPLPTLFPDEDAIVKQIIEPLIRGLQCLHENGIAHRDIKPENMMYSEDTNTVKWIDMGLSCIQICTGAVGTPATAAPEVLTLGEDLPDGLHIWINADIWSLGTSIYYMMTAVDYPVQVKYQTAFEDGITIDYRKAYQEQPNLKDIDGKRFPRIKALLNNLLQINPKLRRISTDPVVDLEKPVATQLAASHTSTNPQSLFRRWFAKNARE
jgi:serine/threonine protein kinase